MFLFGGWLRNVLLASLVILFPVICILAADSKEEVKEGSSKSCPACAECSDCSASVQQASQAENRLSKVMAELQHLKDVNEESVKACSMVSQKQVESLEECQKGQQRFGEMLNKVQIEKQELNAKIEFMSKDVVEKEVSCKQRIEQCNDASAETQQVRQKLQEAEAKLSSLVDEQSRTSESLIKAVAEREALEKRKSELSAEFDSANSRIRELSVNIEGKEGQFNQLKERFSTAEAAHNEVVSSLTGKLQAAEKNTHHREEDIRRLSAEMREVEKRVDASASLLFSWDSFERSAHSARVFLVAISSFAIGRVPKQVKDSLHQNYIEYRMGFVDPAWQKIEPLYKSVFEAFTLYTRPLTNAYKKHVQPTVSAQAEKVKSMASSYWDVAQEKAEVFNSAFDRQFIIPIQTEYPELQGMLPTGILDRVMCCFFLFFVLLLCYKVSMVALTSIVAPVFRFALCGMCRRRSRQRGMKKTHITSKNKSSSSGSSYSSGSPSKEKDMKKRPMGSSADAGGIRGSSKPFRPEGVSGDGSTTATTTASSIGDSYPATSGKKK